jgi:hypothetical protein
MHQAPKRIPANEPLDPDVVERLGKMFLMMSSSNDGDKLAAVNAFNRTLEKAGVDHHTLVARMTRPWLSDSSKEQFRGEIANARAIGHAEGLREAESKRGLEDDFSNTDGSSDWRAVARFVSRERHRLPLRNRDPRTFEFIDNILALTESPFTNLSPGRANWLYDLFGKLGGKVDSGIPFMLTGKMKADLHARGLTDVDIENLTPEDAHKILSTPDERAVRGFLEAFVALAIASLGGHPPPGLLQVCRKAPNDSDVIPVRYRLDDADLVDHLTRDAIVASGAGLNVYIEGRLVRPDLRGKKRGDLKDSVCVFALVVDSDADKNMGWIPPAGIRPTLTVETSPGNAQYWFFFERALSPTRAQRLGEALRQATGGDFDTGNPCQPYRIPGTVNYPNKMKIARGRVITPTLFLGATL